MASRKTRLSFLAGAVIVGGAIATATYLTIKMFDGIAEDSFDEVDEDTVNEQF